MHFKLLVVDPDIKSRDLIKEILESQQDPGIDVLGELETGEIVFEYIKINMPDIVLLDIGMPGIDGIEILKRIKEYYKYIVVIIISEHTSFSYARDALKYDAFDFLVKPLDKNSFLESILRAKDHLIEERKRETELIELRSKLDKGLIQLKDQLLDSIKQQDQSEENRRGRELCTVILIKIINFNIVMKNNFDNDADLVKNRIREKVISILSRSGVAFNEASFHNELLILKCLNTDSSIYSQVYTSARKIKISIEEYTNFRLNIGIGNAYPETIDTFHSYRQAIRALQHVQFIDCGGIIQIEEIKEHDTYVLPFDKENDLLSHLEKGYREQAYLFIDNIFKEFKNEHIQIEDIKEIIKELSYSIDKLVRKYDGLVQSLVQGNKLLFDIIEEINTLGDLKQWLKDLIEKVTEYIYCRKKAGIPAIISQITEYIETHYFDCLNLGFIAEKFNISIAYLSRSFKNITGEKYVDYLNKIRMEKAAEKLLDYSNLKIKDVAEMVGFENPYYFMKRFKQHYDCTPSEYRSKKLNL